MTPVTVSGTEGSPLVVSWKKTWTSPGTNVAGLTGRSKVTEMLTEPLAASASGIGPIELVDDPRPGGDDHRPVPDVEGIGDDSRAY